MAAAASPRGAPAAPVPSTASITSAASAATGPSSRRGGSPGSRSRLVRASVDSDEGSAGHRTSTERSSPRRRRAATRPSPPLLPLPQTTTMSPSGASSSARRGPGARRRAPSARAIRPRPRRSPRRRSRAICVRVGQRLEEGGQHQRRTATAAAVWREWVSETSTLTPSSRARSRAAPWRTTCVPLPPPATSISSGRRISSAQGLEHGLLGAEARRQVLGGPRPAGGVGALARGEQPLGQPRAPRERALEAVDLEQVDADHLRRDAIRRARAARRIGWAGADDPRGGRRRVRRPRRHARAITPPADRRPRPKLIEAAALAQLQRDAIVHYISSARRWSTSPTGC